MENETLSETFVADNGQTVLAKPKRERKAKPKAAAPKKKGKANKPEKSGFVPWNTGKEMTLHGCRVGKKEYSSVWAAFQAVFGIESPDCERRGRHISFRKLLKDQGVGKSLDYVTVAGKKVRFTLIERT